MNGQVLNGRPMSVALAYPKAKPPERGDMYGRARVCALTNSAYI